LQDAAKQLNNRLSAIEEELAQTRASGESDRLNYPGRLNAKLAHLSAVIASADGAPTRQSYEVFDALSGRIDAQIKDLDGAIKTDVAAFTRLLQQAKVPEVVPG
jgi:hypothetical protein